MQATAKTYYSENFQRYGECPPGGNHTNGVGIINDPIWNNKAEACFRPVAEDMMFVEFQTIPELKTFDLGFSFRFLGKESESFELILRNSQKEDIALKFSNNEIEIKGKGITAKGSLPAQLTPKTTCMVVIKVDNGRIAIHADSMRKFHQILSTKIPAHVFTGFNFYGSPKNDFALTDLVVSDPAALPDFSAQKHFADFRSLRDESGFASAQPMIEATLSGDGDGIKFRPGVEGAKMTFHWSNGNTEEHAISIGDVGVKYKIEGLGADKLDNAVIHIGKLANLNVKPLTRRFHSSYHHVPALIDILRDQQLLPKASEHPLDLDFQKLPDGAVAFYIDGSFCKNISVPDASLQKIVFSFPAPTPVVLKQPLAGIDKNKYTPLDLSANPRAKSFMQSRPGLKPGCQTIAGVPMNVAGPDASADVGICRQGMGDWALEVDEYLARSPLDGFPSAIHYRLVPALYTKAWILCAIDPDNTKDKTLVARLGRYAENGVGGNMLSDTTLIMPPDGSLPAGMKQVASIEHKGATLPLYLLELQLNMGRVLDLITQGDYIDFELLGKQWENFEQIDRTMKPDPNSTSAFQIFGITLERAPAIMGIEQAQPGNVFTEDEQASTTVTLRSLQATSLSLAWRASDVDGKEMFTGSAKAVFQKAEETQNVKIPLPTATRGYFDLSITLADAGGKEILNHPARFAVLPRDTRSADRHSSPYGTWWFGKSHGSVGDYDIAGPLLKKAGIRKCAWQANPDNAPEMIKYNLTSSGQVMLPLKIKDLDDAGNFSEKALATALDKINEYLQKFPQADTIMVWHESAPGYGIPEELLGMNIPEAAEKHKHAAAFVNACGKFIRKNFPKMKMQIGNSSASIGAATLPLRNGADPAYYDMIGIETPSQVICPEKPQEVGLQGQVISAEIAALLAKRPVALNACYEYTYRCERDMGEQQQAEWYMRDILISLANQMKLIGPGIFIDCANAYYNGLWGGSGIITRGPYVYPKRAYVAYANLTAALDQVKLRKQLPTGSTTAYALAFERADKKHATALWTARGEAEFSVGFSESTPATIIDMYGRETKQQAASLSIKGGMAPVYIVSALPAQKVEIIGRSFQKEAKWAEKSVVADALDNISGLTLAPDPDFTVNHTDFLPILKPSDFNISAVADPDKGNCIEVTLDTNKNSNTSKYITEYTTMTFSEPRPIPGNPAAIGVWVKGNSSWAQIRFTIEDAKGEIFKSYTTSGWGCDIFDWPGNLCVNFDGWCFVAHPLRITPLFNDHSPGPILEQWVSSSGNKIIDMPIKIKAITIGMNRHKLDLLDFKPSVPSIRLKDIGGIIE